MKNISPKSNFHDISSDEEKESFENLQEKTKLSSKAVKSTMTEQLITPPARVWDKIEKILDEQDNRRNNANNIIASSFGRNRSFPRTRIYLASAAGLSVLVGLIWIII